MESEKWTGKTKGSLFGYKFFIKIINLFGLRFSYFFCIWVSFYFSLFSVKQRNGILNFYKVGFGFSSVKAFFYTAVNFFKFGQTLIDRIAINGKLRNKFSFAFHNEKILHEISQGNQGGILISGHIGNWENAGSLIKERITSKINVLMLDEEVGKIKEYLQLQTGGPKFNIIPIKNDLSHVILIHQALKRNELIALHADRTIEGNKNIELDFLGKKANFPLGPFTIAYKFKVPITFVFAVKKNNFHYELSATTPILSASSEEEIALQYVKELESKVKENPTQWFNFFEYYEN